MKEKVNIILDGKHIIADKGDYILTIARNNNIHIPTLCNDPRLEPYSSCYLCVVEIEKIRGLQPACSTKVAEGMVIFTNNERIIKSRKTALELIMSNHYADCIAPCKTTCPAGVDVQGYVSLIEKKMYTEAIALIKEVNPLPAICGRVCVRPCELACNRNEMNEGSAVGIDYIKRFASDYDLSSINRYIPKVEPSINKKVAIIGAGPGGLSAAYFLQQKGHHCDIYEALPKAGGWLRYGIPEYRLPNNILQQEINSVTELGANIFCNTKFGKDIKYSQIKEKYDALILTIGSQKGTLVGVEGDDAENVFSGIDFLKNIEITGQKPNFKNKKVIVVGGGNTAMDCCRTAIRLGSTDVKVVYRRTEKEMPANPIEIHESKLEGVEYLFLNNPTKINKDLNGKLQSITLIKMDLGEPDASGRCRPIPVPNSEYELKVDYLLAAIGQNTDVYFIDDINKNSKKYFLELNKYGNIATNSETLQTSIPNIFAAGDAVTGASTIISAIAQAKIAATSCHQYLMNEEVKPIKKQFVSLRSNFIETNNKTTDNQIYKKENRLEMPVKMIDKRINFEEVELGYSEKMALCEANRCLECGCGEYANCELLKNCQDYNIEQKKFAGEYNKYKVDFSHKFIEIDNNKCILCSRCIRICNEIVGANALGLVNRGFSTYVAPAMGFSLKDTNCQTCGLCIDTCPTGAIRENIDFKPLQLKVDSIYAIDNYGSEGIAVNIKTYKNKFVTGVEGEEGYINKDKIIGRRAKFGYKYLNDKSRIIKPLLKKDGKFKIISFDEAFKIIAHNVKYVEAEKNILFSSARLTNEELYLIQKIAKQQIKTPYILSSVYSEPQKYLQNKNLFTSFEDIKNIKQIFVFGADLIHENDYIGFLVNQARKKYNAIVNYISTDMNPKMIHKSDFSLQIKNYYAFIKAVNYYLIEKNLQNKSFIDNSTFNFENYKNELLKENFQDLISQSGVKLSDIEVFALKYNSEKDAVIIFSETFLSGNANLEIINLAMITGKFVGQNKGLLSIKEKNNSQGTLDMGSFSNIDFGGVENNFISEQNIETKLKSGDFENILIFGEDPIGTAKNKKEIEKRFKKQSFLMVQDYFLTETTKIADLILPASFPIESAGSFTNTQGIVQQFDKQIDCQIEKSNFEQLNQLNVLFGGESFETEKSVFLEIATKLSEIKKDNSLIFKSTKMDSKTSDFYSGADYITNLVDNYFE